VCTNFVVEHLVRGDKLVDINIKGIYLIFVTLSRWISAYILVYNRDFIPSLMISIAEL